MNKVFLPFEFPPDTTPPKPPQSYMATHPPDHTIFHWQMASVPLAGIIVICLFMIWMTTKGD